MQNHPYADLFPMMTEEELSVLAADIRDNGLRQPIIRYEGQVLDGRNRVQACKKAGVAPVFLDYEGDAAGALALVESLNVERRDLSAGQRAVVAAKRLQIAGDSWGGKRSKGASARLGHLNRDAVARKYRVGKNAVQQAKCLLENAPDLAAEVEKRTTTITEAYATWQQRLEEAKLLAEQAQQVKPYREEIEAGKMTTAEALAKVQAETAAERQRLQRERAARDTFFDGLRSFMKAAHDLLDGLTDQRLLWYLADRSYRPHPEIGAGDVQAVIDLVQHACAVVFRGGPGRAWRGRGKRGGPYPL
jgi:ParB-like chromosome segregation protein Spo0J